MTSANVGNLGTTQYLYDGDGRRVRKVASGTAIYVYDAGGQLAAGYSTETPVAVGIRYVVGDMLGSTRMLLDASGGEELRYGVDGRLAPYGAGVYPTTPGLASLKFTGKERDAETGLDYFGARYLSSAQGRWTSPDWSAKPEPIPYARLGNPQTLNLYAYLQNNPLAQVDIDGHGEKEEALFVLEHPEIGLFEIGSYSRGSTNISTNSTRFAASLGLPNDSSNEGTHVNAVRHGVWQATITARFGFTIATEAGNAHEDNPNVDLSARTFSGSSRRATKDADQVIDLLNNKIGRAIGAANPNSSQKTLTGLVLDQFHNNGMYVKQVNKDGTVSIVYTKLSDKDYARAKQELQKLDQNGRPVSAR